MTTLAYVYKKGEYYYADILAHGKISPVTHLGRNKDKSQLLATLCLRYRGLKVVSKQRFQSELDHIHLFKVRSDAPSYELEEASN